MQEDESDLEFQDQPLNVSLLDTPIDPSIAPMTLEGIRNRPMSSYIINVSDSSASSGSPEQLGSNVAPIQNMPLPPSSINTPDLQPEGVNKSNTDLKASKSRNIRLPKGIKTGVNSLSVNIEQGECHIIPAEIFKEGGFTHFHQQLG